MARFAAAKSHMALDPVLQQRLNQLIDLLDTGYVVEKNISGKMSRIEISPEVGVQITYDGGYVFRIDPKTGKIVIGDYEEILGDLESFIGSLGNLAYKNLVGFQDLGSTVTDNEGHILPSIIKIDANTTFAPGYDPSSAGVDPDELGDLAYQSVIGSELTYSVGYNPSLKARVFMSQPDTPYMVSDLWLDSVSGNIYVCHTAKIIGIFSIDDWQLASTYTDDTTVNALIGDLGDLAYEDTVTYDLLGTDITDRLLIEDDDAALLSDGGQSGIGADDTGPYYIKAGVKTYL